MCVMLVVEDNSMFRTALREILQTSFPDYPIAEAADGREAITKFNDLRPQIIFLDIKLPDTNGLHLAKNMRASDSTADIFMFTSYDLPEYKNAAHACGANHFLVKGAVSSSEIMEIVGSVIDNKHKAVRH